MSRPVAAGSRWVLSLLLGLVVAAPAVRVRAGDAVAEEAATFFETKIRPTLAGTCFPCHGGKKTSAGLRVDSRAAAASGFSVQRHWAFEPVQQAEPPDDPSGWSASPIDRFVADRWRTVGLRPVEQADRPTLIRRLSFDLTGLPPTPDETAGFLADGEPGAYETLVDRLLASPRYGERWGRHWLDVARSGNSNERCFAASMRATPANGPATTRSPPVPPLTTPPPD